MKKREEIDVQYEQINFLLHIENLCCRLRMAAATTEKSTENFNSRIPELMEVLENMQGLETHYDGEKKRLEKQQVKTETARTELEKKATDIITAIDELIKKLEGKSKTLQEIEENRATLVEKHVTDVNNVSDGKLKLIEYLDNAANLTRQIETQDKRITELRKERKQIEEKTKKITDEEQKLIDEISEAGKKTEASADFVTETKSLHKQCEEQFKNGYSSIYSIEKQIKTNEEKLQESIKKERELETQKKDLDKKIEQLEKNIGKTGRVEPNSEEIKRIQDTTNKIDEINRKIKQVTLEMKEKKDKLENFEKEEKKSDRCELEKEIYKVEDDLTAQKNHCDLLSEKIVTLEDSFNIHDETVKQFESQLNNQKETFDFFQAEKRHLEKVKLDHSDNVTALQKKKDAAVQAAETAGNDLKKEQKNLLEIKQNRRKTQINLDKSRKEKNIIKNHLDQMILEENLEKSKKEAAEASMEHLKHFESGWEQIGTADKSKVFSENEVKKIEQVRQAFYEVKKIQQVRQAFNKAQNNYKNKQDLVKELQQLYNEAQEDEQQYADKEFGVSTSISELELKLEQKFKGFNELKAEMDQSVRTYQNALQEYQQILTSLKIIDLQLKWMQEELETSKRDLSHHQKERSKREDQIKKLRHEITKIKDDISKHPTNIRKKRELDDRVEDLLEIKFELELLFENQEYLERLKGDLINEKNAAEREKTIQRETSENLEEYKRQITALNQNFSTVETDVAGLKRNKQTLSNNLQQAEIELIRRKQNYRDARVKLHSQNKKKETFNQNLELMNERLNEIQRDLKQLKNQSIEREKQIDRIIILREEVGKTMNDEQKGCDEKNTFIETTSKNLKTSTENIQNAEKKIEEEEKNFNEIQEEINQHQTKYDDNDREKAENYQRLELIGTKLAEAQKQLRESQTENAEKFNEIIEITNISKETSNHQK